MSELLGMDSKYLRLAIIIRAQGTSDAAGETSPHPHPPSVLAAPRAHRQDAFSQRCSVIAFWARATE